MEIRQQQSETIENRKKEKTQMKKPKYEILQTVYALEGNLINHKIDQWTIQGVELSILGGFYYKVYNPNESRIKTMKSIEESDLFLSEDEVYVNVIELLEEKLKCVREKRFQVLMKRELEKKGEKK